MIFDDEHILTEADLSISKEWLKNTFDDRIYNLFDVSIDGDKLICKYNESLLPFNRCDFIPDNINIINDISGWSFNNCNPSILNIIPERVRTLHIDFFDDFNFSMLNVKYAKNLNIYNCKGLKDLNNIPDVDVLSISNCPDLVNLDGLQNKRIESIFLQNCENLKSIDGLGVWTDHINIINCPVVVDIDKTIDKYEPEVTEDGYTKIAYISAPSFVQSYSTNGAVHRKGDKFYKLKKYQ